MSTKRAELLAPAGGMDALKAAVAAGCDAVYIGGRRFGARANAGNFSDGELAEAVDYCHLRGVRVYVTVNTLYYDDELPGVLRFIEFAYTNGADAFIFQDIGAAMEAKRRFNGITLHASTQMTAQGPEGVEYLREKGFSRVVLPRELSLDDIRAVCRQTDAELEVFVHGALCVGYSGQCLLSSMIGGRSGNRGSCAQPCRKRYRLLAGDRELADGYLICPKDLMTLERLSEVISAGADSIKIEGRMKSPEYVYQCVASYRAALDGDIRTEADLAAHKRAMAQVFNRGGFTEGYMWNHSGGGMMSVNSPKPIGTPLGKVTRYDGNAGVCEFSLEADVVAGDGVEIWASSGSHCGAYIQAAASAGGERGLRCAAG